MLISKGDRPGHEFHGNQHTVIGTVSDHTAQRADGLARQVAGTINPRARTSTVFARRHEQFAGTHRALAMQLNEAAENAPRAAAALRRAAREHTDAANEHIRAADLHTTAAQYPDLTDPVERAAIQSTVASEASERADKHTDEAVSLEVASVRRPRPTGPRETQLEFRIADEPL